MKFLRSATNRIVLTAVLILVQLGLLYMLLMRFQTSANFFYIGYFIVSTIAVLSIINSRRNPAYKIAWLIPVTLLPYLGVMIYLIFGRLYTKKSFKNKMDEVHQKEIDAINKTFDVLNPHDVMPNEDAAIHSTYLYNYGDLPLFQNSTSRYLKIGEEMFEEMKIELRKAERYIFMEYFIIEEGKMWNEILEILEEKVAQGVDVRLIYDDFGCLFKLPYKYNEVLEAKGIKTCIFNPIVPVLSSIFNNRDHRKIMVIDGKTAFTGGINLADEYINEVERFGHWKDTGIVMKGDIAWGFTIMFLSMWDFLHEEENDYTFYYPGKNRDYDNQTGFYQPFSDNPFTSEAISMSVYSNLINRAKKYIYITTPYLIIDNTLMDALCNAAKSGIDVRIQTPHIPDKWYAHSVTRSNYDQLLEAGVKIFEYTPGFIHSKSIVVDDLYAVVGSINLDFRSLYLHLENGIWMYDTETVHEIYQDFVDVQEVCHEVTLEDAKSVGWWRHLARAVLNVFAPLM
ncbi:cardiolipin synthase [Vagococcus zengguangii]|uniref:cardiolipin synthase n=1 Tax=Vagococcus zengguangii TaxID=2571750 RepID=UPI0011083104|nr:cardiolipin synthase [Vagococcus zengguangii]TLG79631.1 cardiolipin synthase [Vagococcus zengguangii]